MSADIHTLLTAGPATDNYFPSPVALRPHIQLKSPPTEDLFNVSSGSIIGSASPLRGKELNTSSSSQEEARVFTHLTANGTLAGSTKVFPVIRNEVFTPSRSGATSTEAVGASPDNGSSPIAGGTLAAAHVMPLSPTAVGSPSQKSETTPDKAKAQPAKKGDSTPSKAAAKKLVPYRILFFKNIHF